MYLHSTQGAIRKADTRSALAMLSDKPKRLFISDSESMRKWPSDRGCVRSVLYHNLSVATYSDMLLHTPPHNSPGPA
jgi:hypothetical protein